MTDPYADLGVVGIMCTCSKRPVLYHVMYPDDETGKSFHIRWDEEQLRLMLEFLQEHVEAHNA